MSGLLGTLSHPRPDSATSACLSCEFRILSGVPSVAGQVSILFLRQPGSLLKRPGFQIPVLYKRGSCWP